MNAENLDKKIVYNSQERNTLNPDHLSLPKKRIEINFDISIDKLTLLNSPVSVQETDSFHIANALSELSAEFTPMQNPELTEETILLTSEGLGNQTGIKLDIKETKGKKKTLKPIYAEENEDELQKIASEVKTATDKTLDKIGKILLSQTKEGPAEYEAIVKKLKMKLRNLSEEEIDLLLASYIIAGFFNITSKGKFNKTIRSGRIKNLGSSEIRSAFVARDAMNTDNGYERKIKTFQDIKKSYENIKEDYVDKINLETNNGNRILFLSEVLMGNNATDVAFLEKALKVIKKLPPDLRPNAIVVSGLLEGSNKYRQKDKRLGRVQSLDEQFQSSKVILDRLRKMDIPVIYVISNDDRGIAHDGTIEVMSILKHLQKPLKDSEKDYKNYHDVDQMKYDEAWDTHYRFQLEVVFEYMIRTGRRLRSADEISNLTDGNLRMEEYLLLWEAHQRLSLGEDIPDYVRKIINIENVPIPGKERADFIVTDGLDLTLIKKKHGKKSDEIVHMIREGLNFGDTSAYQDPTAPAQVIYRQLAVEGEPLPDTLVVLDQQQAFGQGNRNGWIISTGGITDSKEVLKQRGSIARAGKRAAHRHATSRKRLEKPSVEIIEADKERFSLTVLNHKLLDKSDAFKDRATIALFNDWQIGSITARPDLQAKWNDFVLSEQLQEGPLYLFTDGDIIHGRNYKGMTEENAPTKLIRIEDQLKFAKRLITKGAYHISRDDLNNLELIGVVPGNHEYDSFYRDTGTAFADYIASAFREILLSKGMKPEEVEKKVKAYERMRTSSGDHLQAWTAIEKNIAGYGAVIQHKILNKGGKNSGGKAPVYQAPTLIEGLGEEGEAIDLGLFAHWHHPQYLLAGDKLMLIAPSIAGLSGFEFGFGYKPVIGGMLVKLGGGLPPQVHFYNKKFLDNYVIRKGEFSDKALSRQGFRDNRHFDPAKFGMYDRAGALQKYFWAETESIVDTAHSTL